jgi:hypothetical protein
MVTAGLYFECISDAWALKLHSSASKPNCSWPARLVPRTALSILAPTSLSAVLVLHQNGEDRVAHKR